MKQIKKIYKTLNLSTYKADGLYIPFDPTWNRVLINLSGGADSAILTFLLCKHIEDNNYNCTVDVVSYIRMWKTRPWQSSIALNVYNWLKNRFPDIVKNRYTTFIPPELEMGAIGLINDLGRPGDAIIGTSYSQYLQAQHGYNAIYNATTKNPPGNTNPRRVVTRDNPQIERSILALLGTDGWFLTPFTLVAKDWIVKQYVNNDVLDLLNTTRSCEGEFSELNYKTYIPNQIVPICNECFWCDERAWAKKEAGIDD